MLVDGGKVRIGDTRQVSVAEAYDRDVVGNFIASFLDGLHGSDGSHVVHRKNTIGNNSCIKHSYHHITGLFEGIGLHYQAVVDGNTGFGEGIHIPLQAIATNHQVLGSGKMGNAFPSCFNQMAGSLVRSLKVVNNHLVGIDFGSYTVKKHEGDSAFL